MPGRLRPPLQPLAIAFAAMVLLGSATPARAEDECSRYAPGAVAPSPRIEQRTLDGVAVTVLLPKSYAEQPQRRYPVLLLLHPAVSHERTWLAETDLAGFTAGMAPEDEAIVVMPDGGSFGFYADWEDGSAAWETFHIRRLLPWVDASYRTRQDGVRRAVAGFSMGGFGAMHYAGRHPQLFVAAGSFTGAVDLRTAGTVTALAGPAQGSCSGRAGGSGPFGQLDEADYAAHNPVDMAARYRGKTIYLSRGNGVPCPGDERGTYSAAHLGEPAVAPMTERLHEALVKAGVEHVDRRFACGLHVMQNAERGLREFWPLMAKALQRPSAGAPTPRVTVIDLWRRAFSARRLNRLGSVGISLRIDGELSDIRARLLYRRTTVASAGRRALARDTRLRLRLRRRARPGEHRVIVTARDASGRVLRVTRRVRVAR